MNIRHFTDERIAQIDSGSTMTMQERGFLIEDTPHFEECRYSAGELKTMGDKDLMNAAYWTWSDYCK